MTQAQINPSSSKPTVFSRLRDWALDVFRAKDIRLTFVSTVIFGLIAHTFALTNTLLSFDSTAYTFTKGGTIDSGRWGLAVSSVLFPDYSMTWLNGLISILFLAVSACVVVRALELKSPVSQILTGGLLVTFPSVASLFSYVFTMPPYTLCILLLSLSMLCLEKKGFAAGAAAVVMIALAVGIYQAYLSFLCCLLLIRWIRLVTSERITVKELLRRFGKAVLLALIAGAIYLVITVLTVHFGGGLNWYARENLTGGHRSIPMRIVYALGYFAAYFIGKFGMIASPFSIALHAVSLILAVIVSILWLKRKNPVGQKLSFLVLVVLYPFAVNFVVILIAQPSINSLTQFGFVTLYPLLLALTETLAELSPAKPAKICRQLTVCALALILVSNIVTTNEAYLCLKLHYENTQSLFTRISAVIQMQPEFDGTQKLAVVGNPSDTDRISKHFPNANQLRGLRSYYHNTMNGCNDYLEYYIGTDCEIATPDEIRELQESAFFAEMPVYPANGSVRVYGDYVIVKFSDNTTNTEENEQ